MEPSAENILQIMNLYARYAHAIDSGDGKTWAECYTIDGRYSSSTFGECSGRENLCIFAGEHFRRWVELGIQTRHWNNQVLLQQTLEGVAGSVYVMLLGVKSGENPRILLQTVYTDQLVREDGSWRLRSRRSDADSRPDLMRLGFRRWNDSD